MPAKIKTLDLVMDAHVHLYDGYDIRSVLGEAREHLRCLATTLGLPRPLPVLGLTERHDHQVFEALKSGRIPLGPDRQVRPLPESAGLAIDFAEGEPGLLVLAGRQIVTAERIEVLGLILEHRVPDGLPLNDTVAQVREHGGIPVLSWAPGKWFGRRGRLVGDLISRAAPGDLILGDTSLRPWGWGEPGLMKAARRRGFRVVAGSDPLPFPEDARYAGQVATVYSSVAVDEQRPASTVRDLLLHGTPLRWRAGIRLSPICVFFRLLKHHKVSGKTALQTN